jgi:hypothetical protein
MTEDEEIEVIVRKMRTVPQFDQLNTFLELKKTVAADVSVNFHTVPGEPMSGELVIRTTPENRDEVLRKLEEWESSGLI